MIGRACGGLSVARQCALLDISRSAFYRTPCGESEENLALMREGFPVGRHRVRRLMALMGLRTVYCRPRTSDPHPEHKIYPYLLRELSVTRADQVWCADITYIPMRKGFLYLVAVMDWHSRKVMSWRLSNTMEAGFCVEALEEAFAKHGRPEIFNADQGSQFTSSAFVDALKGAGVRISMDGRGRWMDNVFVERLWRSLKYECVYMNAFETGSQARAGIGRWIDFYNRRRPHSSHGIATPDEAYAESLALQERSGNVEPVYRMAA
jgi:putative transposase